MNQNKYFVGLLLLCTIGFGIYFGLKIWSSVWELFITTSILSFFYVWKIPGLNGKNLRDIPGIKIYIIAFVWVLISVLLPYLLDENQDYGQMSQLFIAEFCFMIAITIPFDVRDIKLDDSSKKTIPQIIGIKKSIRISILLLIASQIIWQQLLPSFNLGIWLTTLISVLILFYANTKRNELYFSAIIDGLLLLQPFLVWVLKL